MVVIMINKKKLILESIVIGSLFAGIFAEGFFIGEKYIQKTNPRIIILPVPYNAFDSSYVSTDEKKVEYKHQRI